MQSENIRESAGASVTPAIQDRGRNLPTTTTPDAVVEVAATTTTTTMATILDCVSYTPNMETKLSLVARIALVMPNSWQTKLATTTTTPRRETPRPSDGRERCGWPQCKSSSRMGRT